MRAQIGFIDLGLIAHAMVAYPLGGGYLTIGIAVALRGCSMIVSIHGSWHQGHLASISPP
jgi:hypothetical protein